MPRSLTYSYNTNCCIIGISKLMFEFYEDNELTPPEFKVTDQHS